jgi:hypothetical protein
MFSYVRKVVLCFNTVQKVVLHKLFLLVRLTNIGSCVGTSASSKKTVRELENSLTTVNIGNLSGKRDARMYDCRYHVP